VKYKNIDPSKILAITFTRKARQEMKSRLSALIPGKNVDIETFNSFCEKILRKHSDIMYEKEYSVMDFSAKIRAVTNCLSKLDYSVDDALMKYYSSKKLSRDDSRNLFFTFVNDIFSLMDHYSHNEKPISFLKDIVSNSSERVLGEFMYELLVLIKEFKDEHGFRDYTDQIIHAIQLFEKSSESIPEYEYILVDEYQDVNNIQVKLLEILNPINLFVVGDPRQSIYGWRGSKIENILNFPDKYEDATVIQLTKNYRSSKNVVDIGNKTIKSMGLPDLESASDENTPVVLLGHADERAEHIFIAQSILSQKNTKKKHIYFS
jgi:DNA helicase-2/ATP-dependent DNA helicase PcrA